MLQDGGQGEKAGIAEGDAPGRSYKPGMLNKVIRAAMEMDRDQILDKVQREQPEPRVWMYGILYVRIVHVPSRLCYLALCLVQRLSE